MSGNDRFEFPEALSGIYAIVNIINDKLYVGSAKNLFRRWRDHRSGLRINKHHSLLLQRAWNKHGEQNFIFVVIEYRNSWILQRETFWIQKLSSFKREYGYNLRPIAIGMHGLNHTEEAKLKVSKALTGIKRSDETKQRMSDAKKGHIVTDAARLKISVSQRGRIPHNKGIIGDKWPHGHKCRCIDCREIYREYQRNWARQKALKVHHARAS